MQHFCEKLVLHLTTTNDESEIPCFEMKLNRVLPADIILFPPPPSVQHGFSGANTGDVTWKQSLFDERSID